MSMSGWAMGAVGLHRCCYCGNETSAGRLDVLGRYRCDDCGGRWQAQAEAARLRAVSAEVRERVAMWGLPPL